MNTVAGGPEDWSALKSECPTDRKEVLEHLWNLIRPVSVKAMIAHPNPPADAGPMQDGCDHDRLPCRVEGGDQCEDVKGHHRGHRDCIDLSLITEIGMAITHCSLPLITTSEPIRQYWSRGAMQCNNYVTIGKTRIVSSYGSTTKLTARIRNFSKQSQRSKVCPVKVGKAEAARITLGPASLKERPAPVTLSIVDV